MYASREITSKCVLTNLKQIHPNQGFLAPSFELMFLMSRYGAQSGPLCPFGMLSLPVTLSCCIVFTEKGVALFARLDGAIDFLLSSLNSYADEDRELCLHALRLLVTYCKNNGRSMCLYCA